MKNNIIVKKDLIITDEKIKLMCRLNFEENDFLFTSENGTNIIVDKRKSTIYLENNCNVNIEKIDLHLKCNT